MMDEGLATERGTLMMARNKHCIMKKAHDSLEYIHDTWMMFEHLSDHFPPLTGVLYIHTAMP
jgi:hypothetical protein